MVKKTKRIEYRSAKRSRKLIKKAFAKLMMKNDISKISVTSIVETAEISRGTFYAHYKDVYSLRDEIVDEELNNLIFLIDNIGYESIINSPKKLLTQAFDYLGNDLDYYKMLFLSNSSDLFMLRIKETLEDKILNESIPCISITSKSEAAVYISFFASGISFTLTDWMKGNFSMSLDDLSDILSNLMKKALCYENINKSIKI